MKFLTDYRIHLLDAEGKLGRKRVGTTASKVFELGGVEPCEKRSAVLLKKVPIFLIKGPERIWVKYKPKRIIPKSLWHCRLTATHWNCSVDQVKKNKAGFSCSTYGEDENCTLCFGGERTMLEG